MLLIIVYALCRSDLMGGFVVLNSEDKDGLMKSGLKYTQRDFLTVITKN